MTEQLQQPHVEYNSTELKVGALVGNWYEERVLQHVTGVSRCKAVSATLDKSPCTSGDGGTLAATHGRHHSDIPTRSRVIEHTEKLAPSSWLTHSQACYQPPKQLVDLPVQHVLTNVKGPREQQELQRLLAEASVQAPAPAQQQSWDTTQRAELPAHSLEGLHVGARVMRDRDGRPAQRDVTFLAETRICPRQTADRLMRSQAAVAGATATCRLPDPSVPVSIYSEAAAAKGAVYNGTWSPGKQHTFNRGDNFTKLMGDWNKDASGC